MGWGEMMSDSRDADGEAERGAHERHDAIKSWECD
jgi:hypothetical protein